MNKIVEVPIGKTFFGQSGGGGFTDIAQVGSLVSTILTGAIALASLILLFLLIVGGIGIIAGAGSDNPQQVESGKKAVTSAIIGFIIVFAAYWIVQLIEIITGVKILQ